MLRNQAKAGITYRTVSSKLPFSLKVIKEAITVIMSGHAAKYFPQPVAKSLMLWEPQL